MSRDASAGNEKESAVNETDRYADGEASTPTRILDAAEALFMQYGFGPVSLRQVAQGANIRQATLYHYQ